MGEALNRKEKIIKKVYFNLKSPSAYSGLQKVLAEAKTHDPTINLKDVQNFLSQERTYTLFYPVRHRFPRLRTVPSGLYTDWQCDLSDFQPLKNQNDGYAYLLVCIDVLSRKLFVAPTKSKGSDDMIVAFDKIFDELANKPHKIYSDAGVEFQAKKMLKYFHDKNILKYVMRSPNIHAGVVERAQMTIKGRLHKFFSQKNTVRWIEPIKLIVDGINNSTNRITGMTPNDVNFENAQELIEKVYKIEENAAKKFKFKEGDFVRISKERGAFQKGYHPNYSDELFKIKLVKPTIPPHYKIQDLEGNTIAGVFYNQELVKTTGDTKYRIAEILESRTRRGIKEHLVSWVGFSAKYNSWVKDKDIVG